MIVRRLAILIVAVLTILGIPGALLTVRAIASSIAKAVDLPLSDRAAYGLAIVSSIGPPLVGSILFMAGKRRASIPPLAWSSLFGLALVAGVGFFTAKDLLLRVSCDSSAAIDTKEKAIAFMENVIDTPGMAAAAHRPEADMARLAAECRSKCRFSHGWGMWTVEIGYLSDQIWPEVTFDRCGHFRSHL